MATLQATTDVLHGAYPMQRTPLTMVSPAATNDFVEFPAVAESLVFMYNPTGSPIANAVVNAGALSPLGRVDGVSMTIPAGAVVVFGPIRPAEGWATGANIRTTPHATGMLVCMLSLEGGG